MKHTLPAFKLIILMLICGLQTYAQPVITSNTVVGLGESAPVQFALGNFTPGPAGANVNHDFSQSTANTVSITYFESGGTDSWQISQGLYPGEVVISTLSGNNAAGTFSATLGHTTSNQTILVTDGEFSTNNYGLTD